MIKEFYKKSDGYGYGHFRNRAEKCFDTVVRTTATVRK